jgi:PadR family transcriptional regulator PadR
MLKTETENIGKRVRKYYSLTPQGRSLVKERVNEFVEFIKTMGNVLAAWINVFGLQAASQRLQA